MSDCLSTTHLRGVTHDGPCLFIPGQYADHLAERAASAPPPETGAWVLGCTCGADDPPPLPVPPPGMTADALAAYVDAFIRAATSRVLGVGADQYDQGDGQRFEGMPLAELLDWASEELQDMAVYAAMLDIRIKRIKAELERRGA